MSRTPGSAALAWARMLPLTWRKKPSKQDLVQILHCFGIRGAMHPKECEAVKPNRSRMKPTLQLVINAGHIWKSPPVELRILCPISLFTQCRDSSFIESTGVYKSYMFHIDPASSDTYIGQPLNLHGGKARQCDHVSSPTQFEAFTACEQCTKQGRLVLRWFVDGCMYTIPF